MTADTAAGTSATSARTRRPIPLSAKTTSRAVEHACGHSARVRVHLPQHWRRRDDQTRHRLIGRAFAAHARRPCAPCRAEADLSRLAAEEAVTAQYGVTLPDFAEHSLPMAVFARSVRAKVVAALLTHVDGPDYLTESTALALVVTAMTVRPSQSGGGGAEPVVGIRKMHVRLALRRLAARRDPRYWVLRQQRALLEGLRLARDPGLVVTAVMTVALAAAEPDRDCPALLAHLAGPSDALLMSAVGEGLRQGMPLAESWRAAQVLTALDGSTVNSQVALQGEGHPF